MKKKRLASARYITGFDGIRTIAVIGVIIYHLLPNMMKGGYLGVPIFFVVSGYLITDLLRQEYQQNGFIDIKGFYARRMKRLYPAMVLMLVGASAYITLFQKSLANNLRGVVLSSLTYLNNWWQIYHDSSYFNRFGNESPFTHLWSLAVEGQYYFIWPFIFILLIKVVCNQGRIFLILTSLSLVSFILMWAFYVPGKDPTRVYFGTDTRMFSILLGGALAFIWPSWRMRRNIAPESRKWLNRLGITAVALLALSFFFLDNNYSFVYRGGLFFVSILAMILIAVTAHPGAKWNVWLTNPVFTYIGKRSYGIYLYQYPIMIFYEAKFKNSGTHPWIRFFIELFAILLVSELSYRFFEKPLAVFDYRQTFKKLKEFYGKPFTLRTKWKVILSSMIVFIALFGVVTAPTNLLTAEQKRVQKQIEENKREVSAKKKALAKKKATSKKVAVNGSIEVDTKEFNYIMTDEDHKIAAYVPLFAFGDSVMASAEATILEVFPKATINEAVSRQAYTSAEELKAKKKAKQLTKVVWLSLGTNGYITSKDFDEIMDVLGKKRTVFWTTVQVPTKPWQKSVNVLLKQKAKKYQNLHLIDWYAMSNSHEDWFEDQVHPNTVGVPYYANYVAKTIVDHLPKKLKQQIQKEIKKEEKVKQSSEQKKQGSSTTSSSS
ncbi:MAG: acetyltransferase [Streptococcaceae bacterium]|jgi:peptidoglycan/LPS O-acetylase OafA/YrhL|nr:acetyltransferase [Streptococcaceae bacterium]